MRGEENACKLLDEGLEASGRQSLALIDLRVLVKQTKVPQTTVRSECHSHAYPVSADTAWMPAKVMINELELACIQEQWKHHEPERIE